MGYDVSIMLERAEQRKGFDEAAERMGMSFPIERYGLGDEADEELRCLWWGCSAYGGLFEHLKTYGADVTPEGDEGWCCPETLVGAEVLVALGRVATSVRKSTWGDAVSVAETLGRMSEGDVWEHWHAAWCGERRRWHIDLQVPRVSSVRIKTPDVEVAHGVEVPFWLSAVGVARGEGDEANARQRLDASVHEAAYARELSAATPGQCHEVKSM